MNQVEHHEACGEHHGRLLSRGVEDGCWEEDSGCSVESYRDLTAGPAVGEEAQVKRLRLEMDGESGAVEAG